jgi:hypothetical protein
MNQTAQRWMRRPWFSALLLTALLLRVLVPVGYMPGIGSDGSFTVILCPGYAPVPAHSSHHDFAHPGEAASAADRSGMSGVADMPDMAGMPGMAEHGGHGQHDAQGNCLYAGATTGTALVRLAPATLLRQPSLVSVVFPPERNIPRGTIVPTRLPRGPPLQV